jgi:hypothetical protein
MRVPNFDILWKLPFLRPRHQDWLRGAEAGPGGRALIWRLSTLTTHWLAQPWEAWEGRSRQCGPIKHISHLITVDLEITSFSSIRKMEIVMAVLCSPQPSFISASQSALKAWLTELPNSPAGLAPHCLLQLRLNGWGQLPGWAQSNGRSWWPQHRAKTVAANLTGWGGEGEAAPHGWAERQGSWNQPCLPHWPIVSVDLLLTQSPISHPCLKVGSWKPGSEFWSLSFFLCHSELVWCSVLMVMGSPGHRAFHLNDIPAQNQMPFVAMGCQYHHLPQSPSATIVSLIAVAGTLEAMFIFQTQHSILLFKKPGTSLAAHASFCPCSRWSFRWV